MAVINTDDVVSMTDAGKKLPALVKELELSHGQKVLFRNNQPVAALVSVDRLADLQEAEDAIADIALLAARVFTDSGARTELDAVLERFGVTKKELLELER